MSTPARVQSIEALDAFRAVLLVYLEKASRILDDAMSDVVRTRGWLEADCRMNWRRQIREKGKFLAQAEAELLTAKLSGHPEAIQDRRMVVAKAKRALEEVEDRLERVEHWIRHYPGEVESRTQAVLRLRQLLDHDMLKAVAFLETAATTLSDYADLTPAAPPASAAPPRSPHPQAEPAEPADPTARPS